MNPLAELRQQIHALVDDPRVETALLERIKEVLEISLEESDDWDSLPPNVQENILKSYEESFDEKNLIDHETVKARYAKWLS
jgi:hypothetical protein